MKKINILLALLACIFINVETFAEVQEIADPELQDIAVVKPNSEYGTVIVYNPIICQKIGPACGFFKAHEHGHVALNHQYQHPSYYPAQREAQADCWAATNGIPEEIFAAYQLFMADGSSSNYQVYGNPQQRAQRVKHCAQQAGKWLGE